MKQKITLIFTFFLIRLVPCHADWTVVQTGINDHFNSVAFYGPLIGLLAGDHGIYYTTNGGGTPGSWTRFEINSSPTDSIVYSHTKFFRAISKGAFTFYLCGWDSIQNQGIIFKLNISTLSWSFRYMGATGTKINDLVFNNSTQRFYAVGNNGLILRADTSSVFSTVANASMRHLYTVKPASSGTRLHMAGDEVYLDVIDLGANVNITAFDHPGKIIRGVSFPGSTLNAVGNDFWRVSSYGANLLSQPNYDFGPLNANRSTYNNGHMIVATDHGIFRSDAWSNHTFLEYQPSSNELPINDVLYLTTNGPEGFACGDSGIFLYTLDAGGPIRPYCNYNSGGGCASPYYVSFYGTLGTGTNSKWLINGVLVHTGNSFAHIFPSPGNYTVAFIVWNSAGLYDTCSRLIPVVTMPQINLPVTVSDNILCHKEPVQLTIQNSQLNYSYELRLGQVSSFGSAVGNGGTLSFMTDSLTAGGSYFIRVTSAQAQCSDDFTQPIVITVEHTTSAFHSTKYNAQPGEPVVLHATSVDASLFQWTFPPGASSSTGTGQTPPPLTFSPLGSTAISLICTSANGCTASTTAPGPFIYNAPVVPDSNWAFNLDCIDPPWTGYYMNRISQMAPAGNGLLVCGTAQEDSMVSRHGQKPSRYAAKGGYLAHYTNNGVFQWMIHSYDSLYHLQDWDKSSIVSVATDASGNIYVAGQSFPYVPFTDNFGEVHYLANAQVASGRTGFVAKFDSLGKYIWSAQLPNFRPKKIKVDANQHVLLIGILEYYTNRASYCMNGNVDTLYANYYSGSQIQKHLLLKIDTAGNLQWFTSIINNSVNYGDCVDLGIDSAHNIYIGGFTEFTIRFYNAGNMNQVADSVFVPGNNYTPKSYVVKYDPAGQHRWHTFLDHNRGVTVTALEADASGNTYITGENRYNTSPDSLYIRDPYGTITPFGPGGFYLASLDSEGHTRWLQGSLGAATQGLGLWLEDNEISAMGKGASIWTPISSADGNNQVLDMGSSDFFVTTFDTSGNLHGVAKTGNNANRVSLSYAETGSICKDPEGYFYIASDFRTYSQPLAVQYLNDSLMPNIADGFIAKFGTVLPSFPVRTDEVQERHDIRIFPVPTIDLITVDLRGLGPAREWELSIHNIVGQNVFSARTQATQLAIPVGDICKSPGLYFLIVRNGDRHYTRKFILQDAD